MAGTYIEITEVVVPASARAGDKVDIEVKVKNLYTAGAATVTVTGSISGVGLYFGNVNGVISPGTIFTFYDSFIMGSSDAVLTVWAWYWSAEGWIKDDTATATVAISTETLAATISRKTLEYNEATGAMPVASVQQGKRGLIHIFGRNDMSETKKLGIAWAVVDPDNVIVEQLSAWEAFGTDPGVEHEFIGGRFDFSKVGTYKMSVSLYVYPEVSTPADTWAGDVCTVAAIEEPEYDGGILALEIEWDGQRQPAPQTVEVGHVGQVHFDGRNDSDGSVILGAVVKVTKPSGKVLQWSDWSTLSYGQGAIHHFTFPSSFATFSIDEAGPWLIYIELKGKDSTGEYTLDTHAGGLLTAEVEEPEEPEEGVGEITSLYVEWQGSNLTPPAQVQTKADFIVHVMGLNKTAGALQLGAGVRITKPSGQVIDTGVDYELWPHTGAGDEHHFIWNLGAVDEEGTWTAEIKLYAGGDRLLDSWSGDLMTVTAAPSRINILDILPMMVVVMMMTMVMGITKEA